MCTDEMTHKNSDFKNEILSDNKGIFDQFAMQYLFYFIVSFCFALCVVKDLWRPFWRTVVVKQIAGLWRSWHTVCHIPLWRRELCLWAACHATSTKLLWLCDEHEDLKQKKIRVGSRVWAVKLTPVAKLNESVLPKSLCRKKKTPETQGCLVFDILVYTPPQISNIVYLLRSRSTEGKVGWETNADSRFFFFFFLETDKMTQWGDRNLQTSRTSHLFCDSLVSKIEYQKNREFKHQTSVTT